MHYFVASSSKLLFVIVKSCFGFEQASARGGKFLVRVDEEAGRCYLQGGAILVMLGICLNTKEI